LSKKLELKPKLQAKATKNAGGEGRVAVTMKSGDDGIKLEYNTQAVLVRSQPSCVIRDDGKGKLAYELKSYADHLDEAVILAVQNYFNLKELVEKGEVDEED
jgi:hypothetical protein